MRKFAVIPNFSRLPRSTFSAAGALSTKAARAAPRLSASSPTAQQPLHRPLSSEFTTRQPPGPRQRLRGALPLQRFARVIDAELALTNGAASPAQAAGAVVGLVNGVVHVKLGIPSFMATLGMWFVAAGIGLGR